MDITARVLNRNFGPIGTLSTFTSFIWTERYSAYGQFELRTTFTQEMFNLIKIGYYILLPDTDRIMIVESIDINYNPADINSRVLTFSGRDGSSILDRRIIATPGYGSSWSGSFVGGIYAHINYQLGSQSSAKRRISFFQPGGIPSDLSGVNGTIWPSEDNNLYSTIKEACDAKGYGFRTNFKDLTNTMVFEVYNGVDRSFGQYVHPPVIFSSDFENLGPARYRFDTSSYKTAAYIRGPDHSNEGITDRTLLEIEATSVTGLDRREMALDASSDIPDELAAAAMQELAKLNIIEAMDCELDPVRQFVYGRDFFIGDIVQVVTDFGVDAKARVIEFTRCWDENGYTEVPTFEILEAS